MSLYGGDAEGARIGFGCSALVGGRTRREAVRLLEVALDAGITHFDVARVYGTGDAEAYVGEFAASHRDEITLTTKFGIDPLRAGALAAGAKRVLRTGMRRSRRLLRFVRRHGSSTVSRGLFTPEKARSSLEVSLAKLRTDHVDAYLLHDCSRADWDQDELHATLGALRDEGSIRAYGPATTFAEVRAIVAGAGATVDVAQFEADAFEPNARRFDGQGRAGVPVTHGCFRHALPRLAEWVSAEPTAAQEWSRRCGLDLIAGEDASGLLLAAALRANPGGIVLFSSGDPERIRRNASIACERPFDAALVDEFTRTLGGAGQSNRG